MDKAARIKVFNIRFTTREWERAQGLAKTYGVTISTLFLTLMETEERRIVKMYKESVEQKPSILDFPPLPPVPRIRLGIDGIAHNEQPSIRPHVRDICIAEFCARIRRLKAVLPNLQLTFELEEGFTLRFIVEEHQHILSGGTDVVERAEAITKLFLERTVNVIDKPIVFKPFST